MGTIITLDLIGADDIFQALKVNTTLQVLGLSPNNIGIEGARGIAEALEINKNEFDPSAIGKAMTANSYSTLQKLSLSYNRIGGDGASDIAERL